MRIRHAVAILGILASALAACSSGAGPGWTFAPTPPPSPAASGAPSTAASGAPSAAPSGGGAASPAAGSPAAGSPAASGGATGTVLEITASNFAFDKAELTVPAGVAFQIKFTNNDDGTPHNVAIHKDSPTGEEVFRGEIITGTDTRTYDVAALPAGTYGFACTVHPTMTGTLTVK